MATEPRFIIKWNGQNPIYGFYVYDTHRDEAFGSGLTIADATKLAVDHARAAGEDPFRRHIDALRYFKSAAEAMAWLAYDADEDEIEQAAFAEPDQFEEWKRWRNG